MTPEEKAAIHALGRMLPDKDETKDNRPPSQRLRGRERKVSALNADYLGKAARADDTGSFAVGIDAAIANTIAARCAPLNTRVAELLNLVRVLQAENSALRARILDLMGGR